MKNFLFCTIIFFMFNDFSFAQNASQYFPPATGYTWYFSVVSLDSLNYPITGSQRYRRDNYHSIETFEGRTASVVHVRDFLTSPQQLGPVTDTLRFSFENTNGFRYIDLLRSLDSIPLIGKSGFGNFLNSLKGWYSVYRFASNVNAQYTIISRDTTITIDSLTLPLRFTSTGRRLSDQVVITVNGSFSTKKFVVTNTISYLLLPVLPIPIVSQRDTTWHAENVWLVKQTMPSINVDLSILGLPIAFSIPGSQMELTSPTGINNVSAEIPIEYELSQNYPNPFNPSTRIRFSVPQNDFVTLKVFDVLGREVAILVNDFLHPGIYEVDFIANGLDSGTYFYRLEAGNLSESKIMILLK